MNKEFKDTIKRIEDWKARDQLIAKVASVMMGEVDITHRVPQRHPLFGINDAKFTMGAELETLKSECADYRQKWGRMLKNKVIFGTTEEVLQVESIIQSLLCLKPHFEGGKGYITGTGRKFLITSERSIIAMCDEDYCEDCREDCVTRRASRNSWLSAEQVVEVWNKEYAITKAKQESLTQRKTSVPKWLQNTVISGTSVPEWLQNTAIYGEYIDLKHVFDLLKDAGIQTIPDLKSTDTRIFFVDHKGISGYCDHVCGWDHSLRRIVDCRVDQDLLCLDAEATKRMFDAKDILSGKFLSFNQLLGVVPHSLNLPSKSVKKAPPEWLKNTIITGETEDLRRVYELLVHAGVSNEIYPEKPDGSWQGVHLLHIGENGIVGWCRSICTFNRLTLKVERCARGGNPCGDLKKVWHQYTAQELLSYAHGIGNTFFNFVNG